MNITQAFPSEYLKAADLQERGDLVVMDRVEMGDVGDERKPVLYFAPDHDVQTAPGKGLALNVTNANTIRTFCGDETDDWSGKQLVLYPTMVDFQGRQVAAIRVRMPKVRNGQRDMRIVGSGNGSPARRPSVAQELNDEIPF